MLVEQVVRNIVEISVRNEVDERTHKLHTRVTGLQLVEHDFLIKHLWDFEEELMECCPIRRHPETVNSMEFGWSCKDIVDHASRMTIQRTGLVISPHEGYSRSSLVHTQKQGRRSTDKPLIGNKPKWFVYSVYRNSKFHRNTVAEIILVARDELSEIALPDSVLVVPTYRDSEPKVRYIEW